MTFWREYIGFDVIERSAQDVFAVQNTNAGYVQFLGLMAAPWAQVFLFLLVGFAVYWHRVPLNIRRGAVACATMALLVLAVFFTAKTKAPTYLLPLYPFAALFIGLTRTIANNTASGYTNFLLKIRSGFAPSRCDQLQQCCWLLLWRLLGLTSTIYNGFHFNPYFWQTDELAREEKTVG